MAINYINSLKTARMAAVVTNIDAGAGPGTIEVCTAGYAVVLLTFTLDDPCGSVAGDPATLSFAGLPKQALGATAGTATIGRIKDSNGTVVGSNLAVTATGGGGDIEISSTSIQSGQAVNLTGLAEIEHG